MLNRVTLIGNVGADAILHTFSSGSSMASFSVALPEQYIDANGMKNERVEWARVICFGKIAEYCMQNVLKGCRVFVEGTLQHRKLQLQDGETKFITEVKAYTVDVLAKPLTPEQRERLFAATKMEQRERVAPPERNERPGYYPQSAPSHEKYPLEPNARSYEPYPENANDDTRFPR